MWLYVTGFIDGSQDDTKVRFRGILSLDNGRVGLAQIDIVISEFMDDAAVDDLRADHSVLYDADLVERPEALHAALAGAQALIVRNKTQVNEALLAKAPRLCVVGRLGVGLDNIDLESCKARGVAIHPASGANAIAVAEYVIGMTLRLLRGAAHDATASVLGGAWPRNACIGGDAHGRTLGLLGFGAIGQMVAVRATVLGMKVVACDPYVAPENTVWDGVRRVEVAELLAQSDIVSVHVPLTQSTHHMIDGTAIGQMKPGAIVINTARGGVIDERALVDALSGGHLAGAALDVFEEEPVSAVNSGHLQDVPGLVLTPHIAGITHESNVLVSKVTADNVRRALAEAAARVNNTE